MRAKISTVEPTPTLTPTNRSSGIGDFCFPPKGFYVIAAIGVGIIFAVTFVALKRKNK